MGKRINEIGNRYGRLTVTGFIGTGKGKCKYALWRCKCDCGKDIVCSGHSLRSGNTKSCGCLNIDLATERIVSRNTKHGKTHDPLFKRWTGMLTRCENPNAINYHDYGGRGIKVCAEWHEFQPFYDWAIRSGYKPGLTIDRINSDGNYEPDNCRWATPKTQTRNRRGTRMIEFQGETMCITDWAHKFGVHPTNFSGLPDDIILSKLAEYARRRL